MCSSNLRPSFASQRSQNRSLHCPVPLVSWAQDQFSYIYSSLLSSNHLLTVSCLRKQLHTDEKYSPVTIPDLTAASPAPGLALPLQQGLVWAEGTCLTCQQDQQMSYAQMRLQQRASAHKPVWPGKACKWNHHIVLVQYWLLGSCVGWWAHPEHTTGQQKRVK